MMKVKQKTGCGALLIIGLFFYCNLYSRQYIVDQGHVAASDSGEGTPDHPFKTISRAASLAGPGDTVMVYGGIYRERVSPAFGGLPGFPVVYMAAMGEKVILKGSNIWKNPWHEMQDNVYRSKIDTGELGSYNPFFIPLARQEGRKSLGQIFCDGFYMKQVDSISQVLQLPGTWMLSYDSTEIILNYPAGDLHAFFQECHIEYTARGKIFAPFKRGLGYISVEGFEVEHCANQFPSGFYNQRGKGFPQSGAISTRSGHHWTIRGNSIRFAKSLGLDCGYEGAFDNEGDQPMPDRDSIGFHLIECNTITDCGAGGIAGASQHRTIIRYNRIERTNNLGFTAPETGGIKVHFFFDGVIEGNVLHDNECSGIWLDNQWYNSRVTRNVVTGSRGHGIFIEMGNGSCLVDHNIVAFTESGEGIYMHDASGVTIAHNLLYANTHFGVYMRTVTERRARGEDGKEETVSTSHNRVLNNIFIDNYRGPISMPLETKQWGFENHSDYNLFINGAQWQWEGLAYNLFAPGTHDSRISREELAASLLEAFTAEGYALELYPDFEQWKRSPLVPLEWWRILTHYDMHSMAPAYGSPEIQNGAVEKGAISLSALNQTLIIRNGKTFQLLECPALIGMNTDFYGHNRASETVLPGPFATYSEGFNEFVLVPPGFYLSGQ